ncbi:XrtA/PEP-CTERM system exopolysaccharide export protein [Teredinibacter haidensis]|uniref:XrtA/PEP-CTERM system exopolysaccharide export protein n=1 Tax=Teredinibacter haidensis TaxID=2731755 RepID=UPI0009FAAABE|nr:XrtA/PEP-CTERM system exopolysaccharide export protein [Teredinibacter haidensis]
MKQIVGYLVRVAGILVFGVLVTACGSSKTLKEKPVYQPPESTEAYEIGVSDSLKINVWRNPELSLDVVVRPDGKVSMPLIGDVIASGQSTEQLANVISEELKAFIRNPQVTVIVTNPSSADFQRRIRITGAVNSQLSMPYRDGMTVLDIVLQAGGLSDFASANKAKLYRKVEGAVKVYPIYLDDILSDGDLDTNYMLLPSDIISVPERAF